MKKLLPFLFFLLLASPAYAAPTQIFERSILPQTTSTFDLGTTTSIWNRIFANFASTTALSATTLCLTGDTCRTTWPSGGTGIIDPFTHPAAGQSATTSLLLLNGAASTTLFSSYGPAYFGGTATSTFSTAGVLTLISPLAYGSGGTGTTTAPIGQLLYGGATAYQSVATSSISLGSSLTNSAGTLGAQVGGTPLTLNTIQGIRTVDSPTFAGLTLTAFSGAVSASGGVLSAGTLTIANGGTNSTSLGSHMLLAFNGTSIVATSTPTADSYLATSTTNHSVFPYASTTALSVNGDTTTGKRYITFTYATSTAWTGTTTLLYLGVAPVGLTFSSVQCTTDAGTLNVQYQYGSAPTFPAMLNASTTVGTFQWTTSNTPAAGNTIGVKAGTPASSPTTVSCTVTAKQT